jgi:hypothetical protein
LYFHAQDWRRKKNPPKKPIPILFFSEIGNFNIGGAVNQLIKKGLKEWSLTSDMHYPRKANGGIFTSPIQGFR